VALGLVVGIAVVIDYAVVVIVKLIKGMVSTIYE
jgi:hypothetical protein